MGLLLLVPGCQSPRPPAALPSGAFNQPAGYDLLNQHSNLDSALSTQTVRGLRLAWKVRDPDCVSHTPLVENGRVFFADWGGLVSAVNAQTGLTLWMTEVEQPHRERPWHGFCGTGTVAEGKLFEASAEGRAFALDLSSGRLLWQRRFTYRPHAGCLGRLLCHDGLLYVPVSPVEEITTNSGFRGGVVALDAADGHIVWAQELIDVIKEPTGGFAGVPITGGFALDKATDHLFFATGDHVPLPISQYSDSIMALDARNGTVLWSFQARHGATNRLADPLQLDHGFVVTPQLFAASLNGQDRKLVGAGDKSGEFWVLDRETGKLVWKALVGSGGGIVADASVGSGKIYLWAENAVAPGRAKADSVSITALNAAGGDARWLQTKAHVSASGAAGVLAGDIYFVGSLDGRIRGYRATDGKQIWTSPTIGPVTGPLAVADSALFCATGFPSFQGGRGQGGDVFAFSLGPRTSPARAKARNDEATPLP